MGQSKGIGPSCNPPSALFGGAPVTPLLLSLWSPPPPHPVSTARLPTDPLAVATYLYLLPGRGPAGPAGTAPPVNDRQLHRIALHPCVLLAVPLHRCTCRARDPDHEPRAAAVGAGGRLPGQPLVHPGRWVGGWVVRDCRDGLDGQGQLWCLVRFAGLQGGSSSHATRARGRGFLEGGQATCGPPCHWPSGNPCRPHSPATTASATTSSFRRQRLPARHGLAPSPSPRCPAGLAWLRYTSPLAYAFEAALAAQLIGTTFTFEVGEGLEGRRPGVGGGECFWVQVGSGFRVQGPHQSP